VVPNIVENAVETGSPGFPGFPKEPGSEETALDEGFFNAPLEEEDFLFEFE
jgi:hypothetical protein